jgi:CheY-like chemotaxis protein
MRSAGCILVVEDNPVNQRVARRMIDRIGLRSEMANCGHAAMAQMSQRSYDLILMDINLPDMTGMELTRQIRAQEGEVMHVPIVAMTADTMAGIRERCLEAGMDDYIALPTTLATLESVLSAHVPMAKARMQLLKEAGAAPDSSGRAPLATPP